MTHIYQKESIINYYYKKVYLLAVVILLIILKLNGQNLTDKYPKYNISLRIDSTLSNLEVVTNIKIYHTHYIHDNKIFLIFPFFKYSSVKSPNYEKVQSHLENPIKYTIFEFLINNKPTSYKYLNDSTIFISFKGFNDSLNIKIKYSILIPTGQIMEFPVKYNDIIILNRFYPIIRWNEKYMSLFHKYTVSAEVPNDVIVVGSSEAIIDKQENKNVFYFKECISKNFTLVLSKTRRIFNDNQSDIVKCFYRKKQRKASLNRLISITSEYITWLNNNLYIHANHLVIVPVSNKNYYHEMGIIFVPVSEIQKINKNFLPSIEIYFFYITTQYVNSIRQTVKDNFKIEALNLLLAKDYLYKFPIKKTEDFKTILKSRIISFLLSTIEKFYNFNTSHTIASSKNLLPFTKKLITIQYYNKLKTFKNIIGDESFYRMLKSYFTISSYKNQHFELLRYLKQVSNPEQRALINEIFESNKKFNIKIDKLFVKKEKDKFINKIIISHNYNTNIPLDMKIKLSKSQKEFNLNREIKPNKDTLTVLTTYPIASIEVNTDHKYHEIYLRDNYLPRKIHLTPFYLFPKPDAYYIIFYPDIKFNRKEHIRLGITLKGSHWLGLRPLLPSEERNDWTINLSYGLYSKLPGYNIGYSTAISLIPGSPRIKINYKNINRVENISISTDYYLGEIGYLLLKKIQGYKKLVLTYNDIWVKSLEYLNETMWETGRYNYLTIQFINYHNWIVLRHMLIFNYELTPGIKNQIFNYKKYSLDFQIRYKLFRRIWSSNRLFFGTIKGKIPKQNLFYLFGKNSFENTLLTNFYQIKGSGDMRGYGKRNLSGKNIFTINNEFIYNLLLYSMVDLDILLFTDLGFITDLPDKLQINNVISDAGLGIRLNLYENYKIGILTPFYVSHPPKDESKFKLRFIISTDIKIK